MSSRKKHPRTARTATATVKSTRTGWLLAMAGITVVLVGTLAVTLLTDRGPSPAAEPAEFGHVHGLGVNPADGELYAGTHYGLFRVPEGETPTLAGDRVQDFMGFTVIAPDHFLASGHPGEGRAGPANLGLIESTDGGESWEALSLEGQADFHVLKARHGRVYGFTGGQLLVSGDKQNWDERAELPIADLAISPNDPDVLLATTQQGLARSTDGGRTFSSVENTPLLQLLGWAEDGTLTGVGPDGLVYVSTDSGSSWGAQGSAGGPPSALTVTDEEVYVALNQSVVVSLDAGKTFALYAEADPA